MRNKKVIISTIFASLFFLSSLLAPVKAWQNNDLTRPGNDPMIGTHDWIALHAASWLSYNESWWIMENREQYLLGIELPDNSDHPLGIGDKNIHYVYFNSSGQLAYDPCAWRAYEEYNLTLSFLNEGNYSAAALHAGIMSHYISDLAVFGHVMDHGTDWGAEIHHIDYESYVEAGTNEYPTDDFSDHLKFDGQLWKWNAYDAAISLAYDTTFDLNGSLTCVWMDDNYNWGDTTFSDRAGESLNLCTNYIADVLHTLYIRMEPKTTLACFDALFRFKSENSVYFVPTANIFDDSAMYAFYAYKKNPQNIAHWWDFYGDGEPKFTENIVAFGGRYANRMVRYYEDAGIALIGFVNNGTHRIFRRISDGAHIYAVDSSTYNAGEKDYFVFQVYKDGDRYIFNEWGIHAEGTYAGGVCFIDIIYPNLQDYADQYYIFSWTDSDNDDMPQAEEITLETSGS